MHKKEFGSLEIEILRLSEDAVSTSGPGDYEVGGGDDWSDGGSGGGQVGGNTPIV